MNPNKPMTPLRAIRLYCVQECGAGSTKQVRECQKTDCYFWLFRMGHNPNRKNTGGNPNFKRKTNE